MQNGCTLQSDLVEQLIGLTQMKNEDEKMKFNYILIEASGVSEPHEIAPLFEIEDHEACGIDDAPDHDHDHGSGLQLGEVARLDTCVTLIDSAESMRVTQVSSLATCPSCRPDPWSWS